MVARCTSGQRRLPPSGAALLVHGAIIAFGSEFTAHLGRPCPLPRALPIPKLVDFDELAGRFHYDERYQRPDWTHRR
jgi:hypothetical protein